MSKIKIFHFMYQPDHLLNLYNEYAHALCGGRYEITAGFFSEDDKIAVKANAVADRVIFFKFVPGLKHSKIWLLIQLFLFCRQENFDIVICHRHKPSQAMALISLFLPKLRLFSVVHGLDQYKRLRRKLFSYVFCRNRMTLVAVSEAVRRNLLPSLWRWREDDVVTLKNIIDTETVVKGMHDKAGARKALGVQHDAFVFGTIGRLTPVKGHRDLIDAFAKIRLQIPDSRLVIIGGGPLEQLLKQRATNHGVSGQIIFTGEIPNASRYLKAFDGFVLPSVNESFSLVLLEAMSAKLPIIATKVGGIPEVVDDNAVLVPPHDTNRMATAILQLYNLTSSKRESLGEKAFLRLARIFTRKEFKHRLNALIASK